MITWRKIVPSFFTMVAMVAGFSSLLASAEGDYVLAAQLILVSLILDGLDGTLARVLKGETQFGAELDTFVDITSFGLAPALLLYLVVLRDVGLLGLAVAAFFVLSGASRLSRFRVVDPFRGQRGYLGLPITVAAGFAAILVIATERPWGEEAVFSLNHGPLATLFWSSTLIMLVLQISHVRYAKPTKNPAVFIPFSILLVVLFINSPVALISAGLLITYIFWYAFISPFFKRHFPVTAAQPDPVEDDSHAQ